MIAARTRARTHAYTKRKQKQKKMNSVSASSNGVPYHSIETLDSVKDVAHKVTKTIQLDMQMHETLRRRLDAFESSVADEMQSARAVTSIVASVTYSVETLTRRIGFGSHSGTNHCRGCVPLKTAAARAALLASQLRSALQMDRFDDDKAELYVVTWLELLAHTYVEALLLDETRREAESIEVMVLAATGLERWVEFTRPFLARLYLKVNEKNERFKELKSATPAAPAAAAPAAAWPSIPTTMPSVAAAASPNSATETKK
jgi:hypothetical protein